MVGLVMRIFSLVFHALLGVVMFAIGFVAWASRQHTLKIGILPWDGATLTYCLIGFGAGSVLLALLAFKRILPVLFVIWSLFVLVMLVRGYFFSSYNFGLSGFGEAVALVAASLLAVIGSALYLRPSGSPKRRQSALA